MPKEYSRTQRVADLLQREIATLIQQELQDPRLSLITVTTVQVARDLAHAKIFVTQLKENPDTVLTVNLLNKASKHLRFLLAQDLKLRIVPQLTFVYDTSIAHSAHLSALIDKAVAEDNDKHHK